MFLGSPGGTKGFKFCMALIYPKSCNAILYGQVSHDCTVSQSLGMVHIELRKSQHVMMRLRTVTGMAERVISDTPKRTMTLTFAIS